MATINVRLKDIERVARFQCTHREAAAFLDIRLHEFRALLDKDERVKRAWEKGLQLGKLSLRRKQMRLSSTNSSMAIFMGKQILGQRDVVVSEHTGEGGGPIEIDASKLSQEERNELRRTLTKSGKSRDPAE